MAEVKRVVFAAEETTVHKLLGTTPVDDGLGHKLYDTESQVLLPGEFVQLGEVPPYLLEAVKAGTAPGLQIMTEKKAKEIQAKAKEFRAMAKNTVNVQGPVSEGDAMSESIKAAETASSSEESE